MNHPYMERIRVLDSRGNSVGHIGRDFIPFCIFIHRSIALGSAANLEVQCVEASCRQKVNSVRGFEVAYFVTLSDC